jgi:acetyltransferase-like isoleucine patch superfamily enzyme
MRPITHAFALALRSMEWIRFRWDRFLLDQVPLGHRGRNVQLMPRGKIINPGNVTVHDDVYIGPGFWISAIGRLTVESGVIVGPRLKVYTANHKYEHARSLPYDETVIVKPVHIGENCWIGGDVILLPGVELGEGCVVGSGAVVTKSFGAGQILGGNPATVLKQRDMDHYQALKRQQMIYLKLKNGPVS